MMVIISSYLYCIHFLTIISSCKRRHIILLGTYDDHSEEGKENEEREQNDEGEES